MLLTTLVLAADCSVQVRYRNGSEAAFTAQGMYFVLPLSRQRWCQVISTQCSSLIAGQAYRAPGTRSST